MFPGSDAKSYGMLWEAGAAKLTAAIKPASPEPANADPPKVMHAIINGPSLFARISQKNEKRGSEATP